MKNQFDGDSKKGIGTSIIDAILAKGHMKYHTELSQVAENADLELRGGVWVRTTSL